MSGTDGPTREPAEEATGADRVRRVTRNLSEPRSAGWVAEEADVAPGTASRYLERLVEDGVLVAHETDTGTRYEPDRLSAYFREIRRLGREHDDAELTERLAEMRERVDEWRETFGVETPAELRATVGDEALSSEERERRARVSTRWENLTDRIDVVAATLSLYDRMERRRGPA